MVYVQDSVFVNRYCIQDCTMNKNMDYGLAKQEVKRRLILQKLTTGVKQRDVRQRLKKKCRPEGRKPVISRSVMV